jgi:hypothetical protein
MPAWSFVFYCLTGKIGTLGERPLLVDCVKKLENRGAPKISQTLLATEVDPATAPSTAQIEWRHG